MGKKVHIDKPLPPKPFEIGEELTCRYKPLRFDITSPCIVEELRPGGMSGWMIGVKTSDGVQFLDSSHFRSKTTP